MTDIVTVALIAACGAFGAPLLTLFGVWIERRFKHTQAQAAVMTANAAQKAAEGAQEQAEAAKKQADAALVVAQAEMRRAVTSEREQASADWARFCDANDRTIDDLRKQVAANTVALGQAEMRAEADRQARDEAEKKFRIAEAWMRRAIRWIKENLPGADYPPLPPELNLDL